MCFLIGSLKSHDVGVPIDEDVTRRSLREALLVVDVTVGQEKLHALVNQQGIGSLNGEVEQHLIHFGVAVASHGENLVCALVEEIDDARRIESVGQTVSGTIVQQVAEDDEQIKMVLVKELQHRLQRGHGAVDVGKEKYFHGVRTVCVFFCRANLRQIAIGMKFSARCFRLCAQKTKHDSEVSDYSRTRVDREVPAGMTSFRFCSPIKLFCMLKI